VKKRNQEINGDLQPKTKVETIGLDEIVHPSTKEKSDCTVEPKQTLALI
jgi:hypothetical protein